MSGGADTQSNPSDFDFGEMQQDSEEIEIDVMVKKIVKRAIISDY